MYFLTTSLQPRYTSSANQQLVNILNLTCRRYSVHINQPACILWTPGKLLFSSPQTTLHDLKGPINLSMRFSQYWNKQRNQQIIKCAWFTLSTIQWQSAHCITRKGKVANRELVSFIGPLFIVQTSTHLSSSKCLHF